MKESVSARGKQKGTPVPPKVLDAVFGNLQSCVADVDELRRKRDEDALKCGRVTKSIGDKSKKAHDSNEFSCHSTDVRITKDVDLEQTIENRNGKHSNGPHDLFKGKSIPVTTISCSCGRLHRNTFHLIPYLMMWKWLQNPVKTNVDYRN